MVFDAVNESFSRAAASYDKYNDIQREVFSYLHKLATKKSFSSVLDVGSASGEGALRLYDAFSSSFVVGIDQSQAMIDRATLLNVSTNLQFYCQDAVSFEHNRAYDLIFSNATFHWVHDLDSLFANLTRHMHKESELLFSVFLPGTFKELSTVLKQQCGCYKSIVSEQFYSIEDYKTAFQPYFSEFICESHSFFRQYESLFELLQVIKKTGVRGNKSDRIWTKSLFQRMEQEYLNHYSSIKASYSVAFFRCRL
jgi:malonyl-CoA O-methyltransferase